MRHVLLTATAVVALVGLGSAAVAVQNTQAACPCSCTTYFEPVPAPPEPPAWYVEVEECVALSPPPSGVTPARPSSKPSVHAPRPVVPIKVRPGKTSSSTRGTAVPGTVRRPLGSGTSSTGSRTGLERRTTQISGSPV